MDPLSLPVAAAALLAFAAEILGEGIAVALFIFLIVFFVGRWVIRPVIRAGEDEPRARTGMGSMVGVPAVVVERISNDEAVGCVRIEEEIWTARSYAEDETIEPGTRVHVVEIRGATAVVSP
jgi:membrane protein implicated in regulation of membrane protease activity